MHRADLLERPWVMKRERWQVWVAGLWGRNDGVWSWLVSPGYSLWVLAAEQRSFLQRLTEINSETFRPADKCFFPGSGLWCCRGGRRTKSGTAPGEGGGSTERSGRDGCTWRA